MRPLSPSLITSLLRISAGRKTKSLLPAIITSNIVFNMNPPKRIRTSPTKIRYRHASVHWQENLVKPPRERTRTWRDIFLSYPIMEEIFDLLGPHDIFAMARTTKAFCEVLSSLHHSRWNINTSLNRFVREPTRLREQLAVWDAVISGSFALQFFERVVWKESDLNIFIMGHGCITSPTPSPLGLYLISDEAYELESINRRGDDLYYHLRAKIDQVSPTSISRNVAPN